MSESCKQGESREEREREAHEFTPFILRQASYTAIGQIEMGNSLAIPGARSAYRHAAMAKQNMSAKGLQRFHKAPPPQVGPPRLWN